jgi:hypothetical protein
VSRHREFVRDEQGRPLQVVRPKDPKLALDLGLRAVKNNKSALLDRVPGIVEDAAGNYTFMGLLAKRASGSPCIVDYKGRFVAELAPGDSFVSGLTGDDVVRPKDT